MQVFATWISRAKDNSATTSVNISYSDIGGIDFFISQNMAKSSRPLCKRSVRVATLAKFSMNKTKWVDMIGVIWYFIGKKLRVIAFYCSWNNNSFFAVEDIGDIGGTLVAV